MGQQRHTTLLIDWSVLERVVGENAALRDRLLASFVKESERDFEKLVCALDAHEFDAARSVAHQLCGAARIVGAVSLANAARSLEANEPYDNAQEVAARRESLREQLAMVHDRIRGLSS
jgi:HPt (histidine-containing phosphotransfer) domain-containing protein